MNEMKQSKFVTPVLLYLMVLLLMIAVYINFVYRPLDTKVDELSMKNELIKHQRMEIELAMIDKNNIMAEIEEAEALIERDTDFVLIDGGKMADDIYSNARNAGVILQNITIEEAGIESDTIDSTKSLLSLPATINFISDYDRAAEFTAGFEESKTGAYKVTMLEAIEDTKDQFSWKLSLNLYFYGDPEALITSGEKAGSAERENMWTQ